MHEDKAPADEQSTHGLWWPPLFSQQYADFLSVMTLKRELRIANIHASDAPASLLDDMHAWRDIDSNWAVPFS